MLSSINSKVISFLVVQGFVLAVLLGCESHQSSRYNNRPTVVKQYNEDKVKDAAALYLKGKILFQKFCNSCHLSPGSRAEGDYLFEDIFEILPFPGEEYFIAFVANSKKLRNSGDSYALEMGKKYNSNYEHLFIDSLAVNNYSELIAYIKMATLEKTISE